jgi:F0F1-type ATP synthase beta subunit
MEENGNSNELKPIGRVVGIKGQVVEVQVDEQPPNIYELLTIKDKVESDQEPVNLEVVSSAGEAKFSCLGLSGIERLHRGMQVFNTNR